MKFQLRLDVRILAHALQAFESASVLHGVCLAVPEAEKDSVSDLVKEYALKKIVKIVPGGNERQDSVRLGFEALPPCDIIVVHDGVRPLVTPDLIERTVQGAVDCGGCVAGLPVRETTKRVGANGLIQGTIDRSELWSIQTPQAFRYEIFQKAVRNSVEERFLGTDEAMLVERIGEKVKVVMGNPYNIKVTTPEDLKIAEAYLRLRGEA